MAALHEGLKAQGFTLLCFPCNQFGGQAGGTDAEIDRFACDEYKLPDDFNLMRTVKVKGREASPLFKFLTPAWEKGLGRTAGLRDKIGTFVLGSSIKWNFTKFLLSADGVPVKRYGPLTGPKKIRRDAERLLKAAPEISKVDAVVTPTALEAPQDGLGGGVA